MYSSNCYQVEWTMPEKCLSNANFPSKSPIRWSWRELSAENKLKWNRLNSIFILFEQFKSNRVKYPIAQWFSAFWVASPG